MKRSIVAQTTVAAGFAATLAAAPLALAQVRGQGQASAPLTADGVTTVTPLIVGPPPKVGDGITRSTPKEFEDARIEAHDEFIGARQDGNVCPGYGQEAEPIDFSMAALFHTNELAETAREAAAVAARDATLSALIARDEAARGRITPQTLQAAEGRRVAAVSNYQAAERRAEESLQRVADMQEQIQVWQAKREPLALHMDDIKNYVDRRTRERSRPTGTPGVYVPEEYQDLGLTGIVARRITLGKDPAMRVTGKIQNPRAQAIPIPPIWVTAVDQFGLPLKSEQAAPPAFQKRIASGGDVPFKYDLKPLPEGVVRAVVTFAPQYRKARIQSMTRDLCGPHAIVRSLNNTVGRADTSALTNWTPPLPRIPQKPQTKAAPAKP